MKHDDLTDVTAALEANKLDAMGEYLSQGRRFGGLDYSSLTALAAEAGPAWTLDPLNVERLRSWEDVCVELRLRGEEAPLPSPEQLNAMLRTLRKLLDEALDDPGGPLAQAFGNWLRLSSPGPKN